MFSKAEKQLLATEIEKLLLSLNHPEMPKTKPEFKLSVKGAQLWSFAEIEPNWHFNKTNPPGVNPFNEIARQVLTSEGN